jgi:acetyltransferase-like isoleucine patch superfamily enzyme
MLEAFIFRIINILFNRPLVKMKLKKVGSNFKLGYRSEISNPQFFSIGDNFYSGPNGYFVTNKHIPVTIGDDIMFGPFCKILGGDHDLKFTENHIRYAPESVVENVQIVLENGVWVGANTTILSNAFIGEGAVVASGAIVNGYIPPYCIAFGVPAKRFKRRLGDEQLTTILANVKSKYTFAQVKEIYKNFGVD